MCCIIASNLYTQVLHYSNIKLNPRKDGNSFYLPYDDLPHMINPVEAKLGMWIKWIWSWSLLFS